MSTEIKRGKSKFYFQVSLSKLERIYLNHYHDIFSLSNKKLEHIESRHTKLWLRGLPVSIGTKQILKVGP